MYTYSYRCHYICNPHHTYQKTAWHPITCTDVRQVPEREDKPKSNSINCLCFSPDGSKLVVAVENRVLVYDGADGELLKSLRGHKDTVRSARPVHVHLGGLRVATRIPDTRVPGRLHSTGHLFAIRNWKAGPD